MRRRLLLKSTWAALPLIGGTCLAASAPFELGRLQIIGGAEDKVEGKEILNRFIELAGGQDRPSG